MLRAFIDFQQNWDMGNSDWLGESYINEIHMFSLHFSNNLYSLILWKTLKWFHLHTKIQYWPKTFLIWLEWKYHDVSAHSGVRNTNAHNNKQVYTYLQTQTLGFYMYTFTVDLAGPVCGVSFHLNQDKYCPWAPGDVERAWCSNLLCSQCCWGWNPWLNIVITS